MSFVPWELERPLFVVTFVTSHKGKGSAVLENFVDGVYSKLVAAPWDVWTVESKSGALPLLRQTCQISLPPPVSTVRTISGNPSPVTSVNCVSPPRDAGIGPSGLTISSQVVDQLLPLFSSTSHLL